VIRVLVVDDDFRVAQLHASYVGRVPGFEVVGVAHTAAEALARAEQVRPDLVLLDEYLPDRRGTTVLRALQAAVILVTAADDGEVVRRAVSLGAVNVVLKPFAPAVLTRRLEAFARFRSRLDHGHLDQATADRAMAALRDGDSPTVQLPKGRSAVTAEAITAVLRETTEPMTAVAIAEATGVSRATAQRYLSDLARSGRVELTLRYGATGRPEHRYAWRPPTR
jgi:two-component system CitB family response regulator